MGHQLNVRQGTVPTCAMQTYISDLTVLLLKQCSGMASCSRERWRRRARMSGNFSQRHKHARACGDATRRARRVLGGRVAETTWPRQARRVQYTNAYLEVLELERRLLLRQSICGHRAICCQSRAGGDEILAKKLRLGRKKVRWKKKEGISLPREMCARDWDGP